MKRKLVLLTILMAVAVPTLAGAEEDIPEIINTVMPFAEELLGDYGEFFPFGGAIKSDGEVVTISGTEGMGAQPLSKDVIDTVRFNLQIGAGNREYRATALVYKVNVLPPAKKTRTDAVAIEVDHISGYSAILIFPYSVDDSTVTFGEVFAQGGNHRIFTPPPRPEPGHTKK